METTRSSWMEASYITWMPERRTPTWVLNNAPAKRWVLSKTLFVEIAASQLTWTNKVAAPNILAVLILLYSEIYEETELSEELALQSNREAESETSEVIENENDVVTFKLKYLGCTVVEKITGDSISTESVKNIMKTAKAKGRKKLQRVNVAISLKGIAVMDLQGNDIFKVSIYRISNCSTDPTHRQIFSFISTDTNETMECHAFICSKRKMAETVTLAVAHAFSTAYEAWRILPTTKEFQKNAFNMKENEQNTINREAEKNDDTDKNNIDDVVEEKLIDFEDELNIEEDSFILERPPCESNVNSQWVCFDDDFVKETPSKRHTQVDLIFA